MIPDSDISAARGRLAEIVGAEVALKPKGRELAGLCPFHEEKTPSFYVAPDKGFYHCFGCGAHGTAIDFVMCRRGLDFVEAVRWVLDMAVPITPPSERAAHNQKPDRTESGTDVFRIKRVLAQCGPVTEGTAAHLYLVTRGLNPDQPALLAHPALYCSEVRKPLPALVAPITNSLGEVTSLQRVWCAERVEFDGTDQWKDARASLAVRKKTLGQMYDGSVRLAPAGAILGLAEGVETAIAASMLYRLPVWATCGLSRLGYPAHWSEPIDGSKPRWIEERAPTVWIPPEVRALYIFGDRGQIGETVAEFAARWWSRQSREDGFVPTQAVFPEAGYSDFADQLIGKRRAA
jgi:hypothetical protein